MGRSPPRAKLPERVAELVVISRPAWRTGPRGRIPAGTLGVRPRTASHRARRERAYRVRPPCQARLRGHWRRKAQEVLMRRFLMPALALVLAGAAEALAGLGSGRSTSEASAQPLAGLTPLQPRLRSGVPPPA